MKTAFSILRAALTHVVQRSFYLFPATGFEPAVRVAPNLFPGQVLDGNNIGIYPDDILDDCIETAVLSSRRLASYPPPIPERAD